MLRGADAGRLRRVLQEQEDLFAPADGVTPSALRLSATQDRWRQFPGSRPGGTGRTGLHSNDARGWTALQDDNLNALELMSDEPLQVRGNYGGTNFADQSFSIGGGMDARQEQRARLLEALLVNTGHGDQITQVRNMKGRW